METDSRKPTKFHPSRKQQPMPIVSSSSSSSSSSPSSSSSSSSSSSCQSRDLSTGGVEPKNKLKRFKSIKRSPSSKPIARLSNRRSSPIDLHGNAGVSQTQASIQSGKEEIQVENGPEDVTVTPHAEQLRKDKRITRTDSKKRLKKLRSVKMSNPSSHSCESIREQCSNDAKPLKPKREKAVRSLARKPSLKPSRNRAKLASTKLKTPTQENRSATSQFSESGINRATCSSMLKDTKFPELLELHQGRELAEVCPYNFCCLSGHHHSRGPSLNRSLSKKRRMLKTQRSLKMKGLSPARTKHCHDMEDKGKKMEQKVHSGNVEPSRNLSLNNENKDVDLNSTTTASRLNYYRMWHLLYHSVKSHKAAEVKPQSVHNHNGCIEEHLNDSVAFQGDLCDRNEEMSSGNQSEGDQDSELKIDAVKLVQEALDTVFPSDSEDQSSDDHSKTVDVVLDRGFSEDNDRESGNLCAERPGEFDKLEAADMSSPTKEKCVEVEADNTGPQHHLPKRWSHMKNLVLLRRFVKELGKVRQLGSRAVRNLPLEPETEAEKVYLRHLIAGERKASEEWLLDYALRQVVSKLSPARKRKVELLVEAFETFIPFSDIEADSRSSSIGGGAVNTDNGAQKKQMNKSILDGTPPCRTDKFNPSTDYLNIVSKFSDITVGSKPVHNKYDGSKQVFSNSDVANRKHHPDKPKESAENGCSSEVVSEILLDKQKSTRMWHMLYQNAVAYVAEESGSQLLVDGIDKARPVDGSTNADVKLHNGNGDCQDGEVNQNEFTKMVKEAFDAIIPPETQEHSTSISGDANTDHNVSETNHAEDAQGSDSAFEEDAKKQEESSALKPDNAAALAQHFGDKCDQLVPKKNWNKLRRIIMLKRFIKQMDKVRKFNPRKPNFLPVEPGSEAERVYLRHQMTDDRRNTEEWMLDFALRQVVAQLTPARKRRVELLVEAFETVNPQS